MATKTLERKITKRGTRILKGYIVYLPEYKSSVDMARRALSSGQKYQWDLELYEGVNGTKQGLKHFGLLPTLQSKKANKLMKLPGVQGCFLSQYLLWKKCYETNETICIFEHDVIFKKPMGKYKDVDVYKFEGFRKAKPIPAGNWYEGARAYKITPAGAKKIIDWVHTNGAMPADWMLCDGIVDMEFDKEQKVTYESKESYTKDLA